MIPMTSGELLPPSNPSLTTIHMTHGMKRRFGSSAKNSELHQSGRHREATDTEIRDLALVMAQPVETANARPPGILLSNSETCHSR
jgi:hypothetical protein